jgi:hypothetical protein
MTEAPSDTRTGSHPRLDELIERARAVAGDDPPAIGLVHPCDALALQAAEGLRRAGIARPLLIGDRGTIDRAADAAGIELRGYELVDTRDGAPGAARRATELVRSGALAALMKGSLHTDELMLAVVNKNDGLRSDTRISHAFVFDLPRYPKLLALADCVVNIAPDLRTKRDIVGNAVGFLQRLGIAEPMVGVVAAVESVNPSIPATLDAQALPSPARCLAPPPRSRPPPATCAPAAAASACTCATRARGALHRRQPRAPAEPGRDLRQGFVGHHEAVLAGAADAAAQAQGGHRTRRQPVRAHRLGRSLQTLEDRLAPPARHRPEAVCALHRARPDAGADRPVRAPVRHAQLRGARRLLLGEHGRRHDLHHRRQLLGIRRPRPGPRQAVRDDRHRRRPPQQPDEGGAVEVQARGGASSASTRCAPATRPLPTSGCPSSPAPTARCCWRWCTS